MKRRNFIWYSLLFIAGCRAAKNHSDGRDSRLSAGSQPARLRFALTDIQVLEKVQRYYGAFRTALEEVLEKKIEFVLVPKFTAAAAALQLDEVDLILTGPSEYVVIHSRTNAVAAIAITRPNYRAIIAVRADSKIKSVAQLKGKKIAMREVGSTSGHLGPTKLLIDAGLDPKSDVKTIMLGDNGLIGLKNGSVDAWGGVPHKYEQFLQAEGLSESAFPLIAKGPLLPNDVFVASSKLAPGFVEEMRSRMVKNQDKLIQTLANADEGKYKGSKLVLANDADYNMIREVYKAIGQAQFIQ